MRSLASRMRPPEVATRPPQTAQKPTATDRIDEVRDALEGFSSGCFRVGVNLMKVGLLLTLCTITLPIALLVGAIGWALINSAEAPATASGTAAGPDAHRYETASTPDAGSAPGDAFCTSLAQLAETMMQAHQRSVPMTRTMAAMTGANPEVGVIRTLVISAYGQPRYSTQEYQDQAARDFADEVMVDCFRGDLGD